MTTNVANEFVVFTFKETAGGSIICVSEPYKNKDYLSVLLALNSQRLFIENYTREGDLVNITFKRKAYK